MSRGRVLVVEDEIPMLMGLKDSLELEGFEVLTATDGEEGLSKALESEPHVIILDIMLPRRSGLDVCQAIRERGHTVPIIMLSARGQESDKVLGLRLGADDYVAKPFGIDELLARVQAQIRRSRTSRPQVEAFRFADVELDFRKMTATKGGHEVNLTHLEFETIHYLIDHRDEVVSREELLSEVWQYKEHSTTRAVDNVIARLRKKLEDEPASPEHVLTVHGFGYKFIR